MKSFSAVPESGLFSGNLSFVCRSYSCLLLFFIKVWMFSYLNAVTSKTNTKAKAQMQLRGTQYSAKTDQQW